MKTLEPVASIDRPGWMLMDETVAVMRALGAQDRKALFVGGCVRNTLLGEVVDDIDIATQHTPQEVIRLLEGADIRAVPTGIDYGTVTAVCGKRSFEITTLRRDIETDGRRAVVAYTLDWREDALRRDFTMNTLLADMDGRVFDPVDKGLEDLRARRVIFVGDPVERISEDALRILRFFRFHARYGRGGPDAAALEACRDSAFKINGLSKERITQEVFKILVVDDPVGVLGMMRDNNILPRLFCNRYDEKAFGRLCETQRRYGCESLAARLMMLCAMQAEDVKKLCDFLLVPKVFQKDMESVFKTLASKPLIKDDAVRESVYRHGRTATAQAVLIEHIQGIVEALYVPHALEIVQGWQIPDFPVSGGDLLNAGMAPGPEMGRTLQELEDIWIEGGFAADRETLMTHCF